MAVFQQTRIGVGSMLWSSEGLVPRSNGGVILVEQGSLSTVSLTTDGSHVISMADRNLLDGLIKCN